MAASPPLSACDIGRAVADGRTSAEQVVVDALRRLHEADGSLRAFVEVSTDDALAAARTLDARLACGHPAPVWAGVPIAVKGRGDAVELRRLRAAGAIPIGRTAVPRGPGPQTWGHTDRGPTRNPHRPDLSPGGSSAGSAAAVAAGIVPVATGSDGAGSTRIPAAWCGILGYKPTAGLGPGRDPSGLACAGPLVADARDLAGWAGVVLGPLPACPPPRTATWSPDLGFAGDQLDPEVVGIARHAAEVLMPGVQPARLRLADPAPAWTALRDPHAPAADLAGAAALRAANDRSLAALFATTDLLLTPTTPGGPHGHDGPGDHMSVALTWSFNLSGHPALSIPAGFTADGAPVGVQVVARHGADRALLALAGVLGPCG
ncbi:amidase family protein [Pseudonocardia sp.]|uniref:amidase family protein n=1 Tax=Pseudonocardia sp. TaxID=60912 RepID=UPI00262B56EA|nr:amidase family protein [Pseudonocardia sp.]